jgi:hypothetical protein
MLLLLIVVIFRGGGGLKKENRFIILINIKSKGQASDGGKINNHLTHILMLNW